jgi:hypothetical protein
MSWDFYLVPRPTGAEFSLAALAAMNAWWDDYPIYRRSDGVIAICRDKEYSEAVIRDKDQDELRCGIELIKIEGKKITFCVMGCGGSQLDALYAFMLFCQANWPCELLDQREFPDTPERFREVMIKTTT